MIGVVLFYTLDPVVLFMYDPFQAFEGIVDVAILRFNVNCVVASLQAILPPLQHLEKVGLISAQKVIHRRRLTQAFLHSLYASKKLLHFGLS